MSQEPGCLLLTFFILDGLIIPELSIVPSFSLHRSTGMLIEIIMIVVLKTLSQGDFEAVTAVYSRKHHKTLRIRTSLLPIACNRVSFFVVT
jgi:hypothetical protein